MAISQRLQMRQGQSLVMTPQLQQAIKLLQLSNIELAEYVEAEIEKNPLIQKGDGSEDNSPKTEAVESNSATELDLGAGEAQNNLDAPREDAFEADSPSEQVQPDGASGPSASVDWSGTGKGGSSSGGGDDYDFESNLCEEVTLRSHLEDQLKMSGLQGVDQFVAQRLIDELDEVGYMRTEPAEIAETLGTDIAHIERVLGVCQGFEPTGVFAKSLEDCLAIQLKEKNRFDPAMAAMLDNLQMIAKGNLKGLAEICGVDREDLSDMLTELRDLSPRPAAGYAGDAAPTVVPDVFVREMSNGMFAVELNSDTLPKVLLDRTYYAEVNNVTRTEDEKEFVSECHANANWLIKSLDQRARTILKVSQEIIRQQDGFFVRGVQALRPLNLKAVADAVDMHESTISRVTSNKFMSTPRGVFELKYFFSASIPAIRGGEAHSAEAVRYRIKAMIDDEASDAVLSDDQIVERLRAHGIDIARRTVAKYRESLRIPSSVERRRILARSA
ncbi:RNA polymerase factor sigma-54 [Hirschia baltica]|uniref:RNA polymerase sigma-54 factor n=1 Tax=Hirschia baltica (strain ATCC 49814 / DSM 5838 / IFAM 1418) TaxID=582402 RepID=C6XLL9_HIRBI|nr:RNA polymerase factor sigma-54 [Hirschia baltica]ACT57925.1 RNA polymerase, sigma 54 subunit, RpoN [Hirschia baltica ATCC 49814]